MDGKSTGKLETGAPEEAKGGPPRAPLPSGLPWTKIAIVAAILAALVWGILLGLGYTRYVAQREATPPPSTPRRTEAAPAPASPSLVQPVELKSTLDAYKQYLVLDPSGRFSSDARNSLSRLGAN